MPAFHARQHHRGPAPQRDRRSPGRGARAGGHAVRRIRRRIAGWPRPCSRMASPKRRWPASTRRSHWRRKTPACTSPVPACWSAHASWKRPRSALTQASGLDPNQFDAYAMQAQLALGRGDLDEAERLSRLAARVAPDHPQLAAIDGMLALRRGNADDALKIVSAALQREPERYPAALRARLHLHGKGPSGLRRTGVPRRCWRKLPRRRTCVR